MDPSGIKISWLSFDKERNPQIDHWLINFDIFIDGYGLAKHPAFDELLFQAQCGTMQSNDLTLPRLEAW